MFRSRRAIHADWLSATKWGMAWSVASIAAWWSITRATVAHGRVAYFAIAAIVGVTLGSISARCWLSRISQLAQMVVACLATGVSASLVYMHWVWPWSGTTQGIAGTAALFLSAMLTTTAVVGLCIHTESSLKLRSGLAGLVIVGWFTLMAVFEAAVTPFASSQVDLHFLPLQLPQSLVMFLPILGPAAVPPAGKLQSSK